MSVTKQLNSNYLIVPCLMLGVGLYGFYLLQAQPQVPYMDTMLYIMQIDQILKGESSWLSIYGSGDHRGIFYPLITFIEWVFWGLNARISTALTGVVIAGTFYYWMSAFLNVRPGSHIVGSPGLLLAICLVATVIIVSPAGFELWTLDLGFAQLLKNFLIVTFIYLLTVKRYWEKSITSAFLIGLYGASLILFVAYGWSYPFLLACLVGIALSMDSFSLVKWRAAVVVSFLVGAQVIYIVSGSGVLDENQGRQSLAILTLLKGMFYGAGTVFIGKEALEKISLPIAFPIILGLMLLVLAGFALLSALLNKSPQKTFFASLLIFALGVLGGVTVARGGVEYTNTGASRYFVDYVWLLLASVAIAFQAPNGARPLPGFFGSLFKKLLLIMPGVAGLLLIAALLGHIATWYVELKTAPYRAMAFEAMAGVYRAGVQTEADAALLQSPFPIAQKAVDVAQFYNLSVLRDNPLKCDLASAVYEGAWYAPEVNHSRWLGKDGSMTVFNCPGELSIKGYLPENFNATELTITYAGTTKVILLAPGKEFSFVLNLPMQRRHSVNFTIDQTTIPAAAGINADTRELGLLLTYVGK